MKREATFHPRVDNRSNGRRSFYLTLVVFLALLICSIASTPRLSSADTDIHFHDAKTKFYNDNGFPKLRPESPLELRTTFSVDEKTDIYFMLEPSQDNLPLSDSANFQMRIRLWNDTWSYTDLGVFGDDWPLTGPTNIYTVVPGYNYTVEMEITFTESVANKNDTFEFSVVIGIKTGGGYNPSDSITHLVQFSEEGPPPDITASTTDTSPFFIIIALALVVAIALVYYVIYRRSRKNEGDEETN